MTVPVLFKYANLYLADADGAGLRQITKGRRQFDECPAWSPDGRQIAFSFDQSGTSDMWVENLRTSTSPPAMRDTGGDR